MVQQAPFPCGKTFHFPFGPSRLSLGVDFTSDSLKVEFQLLVLLDLSFIYYLVYSWYIYFRMSFIISTLIFSEISTWSIYPSVGAFVLSKRGGNLRNQVRTNIIEERVGEPKGSDGKIERLVSWLQGNRLHPSWMKIGFLVGAASNISEIITPKIGEGFSPILTIIFFKGAGSTTN